jgi:hypothetical protein
VRKTADRTKNPYTLSKPENVTYKVSEKLDYFDTSLSIHKEKSVPFRKSSDTLEIYEFGKDVFKLPVKLKGVIDCVRKAQNILCLEDNWDNEGSEGYLSETWLAVVYFLFYYGEQIYLKFGHCIDVPKIYPSSKGSIDIDWETDSYGLIINVAKGGEQATYYGDNKGHQMTEGVFNPKDFNINLLPKAITEAGIFWYNRCYWECGWNLILFSKSEDLGLPSAFVPKYI